MTATTTARFFVAAAPLLRMTTMKPVFDGHNSRRRGRRRLNLARDAAWPARRKHLSRDSCGL
ncbi:MAG: hypothetical protein U9R68_06885, partial [Planctomycetota bacterium]|nr:hypothetical protein [Planctomycetota bacterium]